MSGVSGTKVGVSGQGVTVLTIYLSPGPRSYSYVCGHERLPWIGLRRFCLSARDDGISIGMKNVDKSLNVFYSNSLRAD